MKMNIFSIGIKNASLFILCSLFFSVSAVAQEVVRGDCTPLANDVSGARSDMPRRLPTIRTNWDSTRVYRQAVILVSFTDTDFKFDNPRETYDSMFNCPGYNKRLGPGCAADYFREQSNGMFNVQFDVFGPIKVNEKAQPYSNPDEGTRNYGRSALSKATKIVIDSLQVDFTPYCWSNNGRVNQVIYVCAGYTGNQKKDICYGHIWPNTGTFTAITTPNGKIIQDYTASAELWSTGVSCGIGTILHEYTHSLGLPDIYPTSSTAGYSVVDEWDLMDGGNFTNYGWCPPNYTPLEKMLMGWLTPVELTDTVSIKNMKPLSEGGCVYRIKHSASEWLLLENRQQTGWDKGAPGKGLVIYHVNYDKSVWSGNTVNNTKSKQRFHLFNADNMDYNDWEKYLLAQDKPKQYANSDRMNSNFLSGSPYPWTNESTMFVNNMLTDDSVPAATMNYPGYYGETKLMKSILNIVQNDDGTINFDFVGDLQKCATPVITYENGKLRFSCETEGVKFVSKVTTEDVQEGEGDEIALTTQYHVTVYATAEGYYDSETVNATIKWSDDKMKVENVTISSVNDNRADVNNDGSVNVADISSIIDVMAGEKPARMQ